jgi:hypothetical protein
MLDQGRNCARRLALFAVAAAVCGTGWAQQGLPAAAPWYWHYEHGVRLIEQGQGREARVALEEALRIKADEGLAVQTEEPRRVDYLPHLYLAIACHRCGDLTAARSHLAQAELSGVAARSETGLRLLTALRALLSPAPDSEVAPQDATPLAAAANTPAGFMVFERKPVVLSDSEFARLQKDVLSRCQLAAAPKRRNAPWYYNYELGLELGQHGDNQRALDALIVAAQVKPVPQQSARTYGMWFLDYLPYLAIAKAHARLGNRECALDALAISERLGETNEKAAEVKALLSELRGAK